MTTQQSNSTLSIITRELIATLPDTAVGNIELLDWIQRLRYARHILDETLAKYECEDEAIFDVVQLGLLERRLTEEAARRERVHAAGQNLDDIRIAQHDAWLLLAGIVKERTRVVDLLNLMGYAPGNPRGRDRNIGAPVYNGPCPICREGTDRFIVWERPADADIFYCRRCGNAGDVIRLVQLAMPGAGTFYRATAYLATRLGLPLPEPPKLKMKPAKRRRKPETAIVGGKLVVLDA